MKSIGQLGIKERETDEKFAHSKNVFRKTIVTIQPMGRPHIHKIMSGIVTE